MPRRCQDDAHDCGSVVWYFLCGAATVPGDQPVTSSSLPVIWVALEVSFPGRVPPDHEKITAPPAPPKPPSTQTFLQAERS